MPSPAAEQGSRWLAKASSGSSVSFSEQLAGGGPNAPGSVNSKGSVLSEASRGAEERSSSFAYASNMMPPSSTGAPRGFTPNTTEGARPRYANTENEVRYAPSPRAPSFPLPQSNLQTFFKRVRSLPRYLPTR